MSVSFRKLYADLVTEDGVVCVAYLAWLRAGGRTVSMGGVELYQPDGRREISRAVLGPARVSFRRSERGLQLRLRLREGRFVLRHENALEPWTPAGAPPAPDLAWSVEVPRATASASWPDSGRPALAGLGYADWVEIHRIPRRLRLAGLAWGRCHLPAATVVFTEVAFHRSPAWRRGAVWQHGEPAGGAPQEWPDFRLDPREGGRELQLLGPRGAPGPVVEIAGERDLHAGPALDGSRFPSSAERLLVRALAGPVAEVRRLGLARPATDHGVGWALHEQVRFGREARHLTAGFTGARA